MSKKHCIDSSLISVQYVCFHVFQRMILILDILSVKLNLPDRSMQLDSKHPAAINFLLPASNVLGCDCSLV